jgi:hypothetical protein
LHFVAANGSPLDRQLGHTLLAAGAPNTVVPRLAMSLRYGTTKTK